MIVIALGFVPSEPETTLDEEKYAKFKRHTYEPLRPPSGKSSCAICLDDFRPGDALVECPCTERGCSSVFHEACATPWFQGKQSCPLCRTQFDLHSGEDGDAGLHGATLVNATEIEALLQRIVSEILHGQFRARPRRRVLAAPRRFVRAVAGLRVPDAPPPFAPPEPAPWRPSLLLDDPERRAPGYGAAPRTEPWGARRPSAPAGWLPSRPVLAPPQRVPDWDRAELPAWGPPFAPPPRPPSRFYEGPIAPPEPAWRPARYTPAHAAPRWSEEQWRWGGYADHHHRWTDAGEHLW